AIPARMRAVSGRHTQGEFCHSSQLVSRLLEARPRPRQGRMLFLFRRPPGMKKIIMAMIVCAVVGLAPRADAQQTTGSITGRILDAQNAAVPGVTVTAKNPQTGFTRSDVSDSEGVYRLTALPVGTYDVTAELSGFNKVENKGLIVNVGQSLEIGMTMK